MNTIECIKSRRSIREFTDQPVSRDVLEKIVDAASFSPSWKNTQISRYIAVEDTAVKERIMACVNEHNRTILAGTPLLVVVSYVKNRCGFERDGSYSTKKGGTWQMFDAGIATQTFCLASHEMGVGSVILGIFDPDGVAEALELPDTQEVGALLAVGYEKAHPDAPKRKTVEDLLTYK